MFVSWYCKLVKCRRGSKATRGKATGEKRPATKPKPVIYALTQSFTHTKHTTCYDPSSIAPYMPVMGVLLIGDHLDPGLEAFVWRNTRAQRVTSMLQSLIVIIIVIILYQQVIQCTISRYVAKRPAMSCNVG